MTDEPKTDKLQAEETPALRFDDPQIAILQERFANEMQAHNVALIERDQLQEQLTAKLKEIDQRFGKVVALQELLQEARAPLAPGLTVDLQAGAPQEAAANGAGAEAAAEAAIADVAPEAEPES